MTSRFASIPLASAALVLLSFALVACGGSHTVSDAGSGRDAGPGLDSGPGLDAGPAADAGAECPADLAAAEGTACPTEGAFCGGPCTDACSFCNILRCEGGTWTRLEAPPAPCFECGESGEIVRCQLDAEYCQISRSDVGGEPDLNSCVARPSECTEATCACIEMHVTANRCTELMPGAVVLEYFGG